jgi:hypothetical protein
MPIIEFDTGAFGPNQDPIEVEKGLHKGLEFLAQMDRAYLLANPKTPPLYQLGLRYIRDPLGKEKWRGVDSLIQQGGGDCKSLAALRATELRLSKPADPARFVLRKKSVVMNGENWVVYHVQILRADGAVEDPSAIMGMKDAFDMGMIRQPIAPRSIPAAMPGGVQSGPVLTAKVAGILARMGRLPPNARVGLEGMQRYHIVGLEGMQRYHIGAIPPSFGPKPGVPPCPPMTHCTQPWLHNSHNSLAEWQAAHCAPTGYGC